MAKSAPKKSKPASGKAKLPRRAPANAQDQKTLQFDPGIFRMARQFTEFGMMNAHLGVETWALSDLAAIAATDRYQPVDPNHEGVFRSLYEFEDVDLSLFLTLPHRPFERIDVRIELGTATVTGAAGQATPYPHLFVQGRFELFQASVHVGDLIVEHVTDHVRLQYWFLYKEVDLPNGKYTWPGSGDGRRDVTTVIRHRAAFEARMDLVRFRDSLPPHHYKMGTEVYFGRYT